MSSNWKRITPSNVPALRLLPQTTRKTPISLTRQLGKKL
jgi:hypothetical protein